MVSKRTAKLVAIGAIVVGTLVAESKKEFHFSVGPKAGVSVMNPYGSISVKPSLNNTVVVNAVLHSDKVEVDNNQNGNRVDIQSHLLAGADADSGRVDYEVLVPADASVTLHSSTGSLRAEKLHGDVNLEGAGASVDVRDISDAHVHVKTMSPSTTWTRPARDASAAASSAARRAARPAYFSCTRQVASPPERRKIPGSNALARNPGKPVISTVIWSPLQRAPDDHAGSTSRP